jgi:hypothetical protein
VTDTPTLTHDDSADYLLLNKSWGVHDPKQMQKGCVRRFNPKNWCRIPRDSIKRRGPGRPIHACSYCMDAIYLAGDAYPVWDWRKLDA